MPAQLASPQKARLSIPAACSAQGEGGGGWVQAELPRGWVGVGTPQKGGFPLLSAMKRQKHVFGPAKLTPKVGLRTPPPWCGWVGGCRPPWVPKKPSGSARRWRHSPQPDFQLPCSTKAFVGISQTVQGNPASCPPPLSIPAFPCRLYHTKLVAFLKEHIAGPVAIKKLSSEEHMTAAQWIGVPALPSPPSPWW